MEPFFFGESKQKLFGIYHMPKGAEDREVGFVLCHSLGQEYIRSHRALLQLASKLSDHGFHVLRFDLAGYGDSAITSYQQRMSIWQKNLGCAIEELMLGSGADQICLCGVRFGATLAAMACHHKLDVTGLLLWDVVPTGQQYICELRHQHDVWLSESLVKVEQNSHFDGGKELPGFYFPNDLLSDLERVNLLRHSLTPAEHVFLVDSGTKAMPEELYHRFREDRASFEYSQINSTPVWRKSDGDGLDNTVVPKGLIDASVTWAIAKYS
jgi:pimeloyl-ACP methyl ester carboxylesterase